MNAQTYYTHMRVAKSSKDTPKYWRITFNFFQCNLLQVSEKGPPLNVEITINDQVGLDLEIKMAN